MIVQLQHGAQLGRKISNPIQKVVNPVGTVITLTCPEEGHSSDLSEYESSSDAESRVRTSEPAKSKTSVAADELLLWKCGENEFSKETVTKWPAVKQTDSSSAIGQDCETKKETKEKNYVQNIVDKKCEEKVNRWSRKESKTDLKSLDIQEVQSGASAKQKEHDTRKERESGNEIKSKLSKSFPKHADSEVKEENGNKLSRELETKTKTKVADTLKYKDVISSTSRKQNNGESSKKLKKIDLSLVQETVLKDIPEVKSSKRSTKFKTAIEDEIKTVSGDDPQLFPEEKKQTEDSDTNSEAAEYQDSEDVRDDFLQGEVGVEKTAVSSFNIGVKKSNIKMRCRESKISKYVSSNEDIADSECKKDKEKNKTYFESLSSTSLDETINEHHFGDALESTASATVFCLEKTESKKETQAIEVKLNKDPSETEAISIKENISYKSVLDKINVTPPKSWSSIVSSSKSAAKESVDMSLLKVSEHFSSDVASSESAAVDKVDDADDCSDEGEERCRISGNEMVAASEDNTPTAGNEDESNGNDDDASAATLGNNKKNRRTKKKKEKNFRVFRNS